MTAHETIFNAINGVHRDPKLSLDCANAVIEALDADRTITTRQQLDTLPFLAVIREVFRDSPSGANYGGVYEHRTSGWECIAGAFKDGPDNGQPRLPVRLLYPT